MNCNDCGGFLPRGCECSPAGDEAFRQHQRDRIAEAQRHDAEQAKPKLTDGVPAPLRRVVTQPHNETSEAPRNSLAQLDSMCSNAPNRATL